MPCLLAFFFLSVQPCNLVPNPSFSPAEDGTPRPWGLLSGAGRYKASAGRSPDGCLVAGPGKGGTNAWACTLKGLQPGRAYVFSFFAREVAPGGGGCVVSGPLGINRDFHVGSEWTHCAFAFPVPPSMGGKLKIRLGTWEKHVPVEFDDVAVAPARWFFARFKAAAGKTLLLGEGESISDGRYRFRAPAGGFLGATARPLEDFTCSFNSNRWVFSSPGSFVFYKHSIGLPFEEASVKVQISYYTGGSLTVEVKRPESAVFTPIGRLSGLKGGRFQIPASFLPAEELQVRLRMSEGGGTLQVRNYEFTARAAGAGGLGLQGRTVCAAREICGPGSESFILQEIGDLRPGGRNKVIVNAGGSARRFQKGTELSVELFHEGRRKAGWRRSARGEERFLGCSYKLSAPGLFELLITLRRKGSVVARWRAPFRVYPLDATDFGRLVPGAPKELGLWWCTAVEKIGKGRALPKRTGPITLQAAANEEEAFQLVLRPEVDLTGLKVRFEAPAGIPVTTRVREVAYVRVKIPTDSAGCPGLWPDPLPDHRRPGNAKAGRNTPFWLSVRVGKNAPAGDYTLWCTIETSAGIKARIPVSLHVYDFSLPEEHSICTAFGFSASRAARYHGAKTEAEKRRLFDLYMQDFRDHRISPYDFAPYDRIRVSIKGLPWQGTVERVATMPHNGRWCLKLADDSTSRSVSAETARLIPVEAGSSYVLSWYARSEHEGQKYMVTLQTYDAAGKWLSGCNIDIARSAGRAWRKEEVIVIPAERSPRCKAVRLTLRPALWDPKGRATGTVFFDDVSLKKAGEEIELIQDGGFEKGAQLAQVDLDFGAWDKQAERYLDRFFFDSFRLRLRGMGGGTFHSRYFGRFGPFRQGTEDYEILFGRYALQLQNHLARRNWLGKAYVYWFDEPAEKDYGFVKQGMAQIRRAAPRLRRLLTEEPREELFGFVDIWCPVLHRAVPEKIRERLEHGEAVWWYVCTGPKAPYLGLFIDHPATDLRVWSWLSWKWGVTGLLVWQTNYWTSPCAYPDRDQDPWEDPMSYVSGYGRPPGFIGYWGNGDGRFLYPPRPPLTGPVIERPVDSIRWEMLREGIEDYEYLALLKRLLKRYGDRLEPPERERMQALLTVPDEIVRNGRLYTKRSEPIYARRALIARAIERLRRFER